MLQAGDIVDRFEVVDLLGVGGLAQVFKVRHRVLGSLHALKVVTVGGPAVARRLLREGSIQAQLRHPNVVAVTDVIEVRGHSALVLEYVEGVTLQGLLAEKGALRMDEALALFAQVLAGVAAAHAAGVLHRDLKPGNILLAPGPMGVLAKVTDFGLAKVLVGDETAGPGDTIQGLVMGTPGYMSPEQAGAAAGADARTDVFALGVVLYEMLTGVQPFTRGEVAATLAATLLGDHVPLGERAPHLPPALVDTVERCLAVDRLARYTDARELARSLYGDRPDLADVVEGHRAAAPLAISLPSVMPLRVAGMSSGAVGPANPTMAPSALGAYDDDPPVVSAAPDPIRARAASAPTIATPAPDPTPVASEAGTGRASLGIGLAVGLLLTLAVGGGLWMARPGDTSPALAPEDRTAALPSDPAVGGTPVGGTPVGGTPAGTPAETKPIGGTPAATPPGDAPLTIAAPAPTAAPSVDRAGPQAPIVSGAAAPAEAEAPAPAATPPQEAPASPVAPAATDAPAVADAAPPAPSAPTPPATAPASPGAIGRLTGTWAGTWSGRPFTLALEGAGGARVSARLEVLVGTAYRTFRLDGTLDTATGRFTASEDAEPGWWVDGLLDGERLTGSIRHPDQKKATSYTAKRR